MKRVDFNKSINRRDCEKSHNVSTLNLNFLTDIYSRRVYGLFRNWSSGPETLLLNLKKIHKALEGQFSRRSKALSI